MNLRKRNAIVKALTTAGWGDVIMTDWERDGDLAITCEEWVEGKGMAGDYYAFDTPDTVLYDEFGTNLEIAKILNKHDCYAEWYNGAVITVSE